MLGFVEVAGEAADALSEVLVEDADARGDLGADGSEVPDHLDACAGHAVDDVLSGLGRNGHDAELGAAFGDHGLELVDAGDLVAADGDADLGVVAIEDGFEVDAMALESGRGHEGGAHVAGADEDGCALGLLIYMALEGGEDVGDGIADMGLSDDAEAGHILADEGAVDMQLTAAGIRRDIGLSGVASAFDDLAIPCKTACEGAREFPCVSHFDYF